MTSIETGPTWSERLNPRNWTLAWKLVVVGLVPALLALTLGVLRVADQAGSAAELGRSSRLLEVREQVADAADALRQERDEATLFAAGGRRGDRGVLETGFARTDAQIDEMFGAIRGTSELDPTTIAALAQTEGWLGQLPELRADTATSPSVTINQVRLRYDNVVESVDVLDRALLRQLRTPGTAGLADALTAVTSATEQLAVEHTVLGAAIRSTRLQPEDPPAASAATNQLISDYREYQVALTPEQLARFGNFLDDAANVARDRLSAVIRATQPGQPVALPAPEWDAAYAASRAAADRSGDLVRNELVAASTAAEERASNLAGINSVILLIGLLVGIIIAVLVARALIRSLRVLRTSALDVAERRLPQAVEIMRAGEAPDVTVDPVPLSGRDEVSQVARAFDAVHGQAVRLAADQAALQAGVSAMFVNLSRRSQALVERQLQLIEELESNEQDADQLSNLFQLDHLATRMRRNSENLLVLAGTDLTKRNIAPVPLVDVLRAAVSEVEQYQRIAVQAPPTATILGRAASDLVHLLAELLDNATNFSPPDSQVVMSTTRTGDGSIVVEVADRGVGMIDDELSDANQRLGGPSPVDVSTSRRMGLFVVGRLGARHGIGVRLGTSTTGGPGSGLTASVTVPAYLVPSSRSAATKPIDEGQASQPGPAVGAPGRHAETNGSGRGDSLSSLVAGTDGPANSAAMFEAPEGQDGSQDPSFSGPPAANGSASDLPTRRPGSTLDPDGPVPPIERHHPAEHGAGDQDEPADRAAAERPDPDPDGRRAEAHTPTPDEASGNDPDDRGSLGDGLHPDGAAQDRAEPPGRTPNGSAPNRAHRGGPDDAGPEGVAERSGDTRESTGRPASGATTPMPVVGRTGAGRSPSPRPAGPRPFPPEGGSGGARPQQGSVAPTAGPSPLSSGAVQPQDGLFAPNVPVSPEPDSAVVDPQGDLGLGESTPIFEEIASAWFRSNRPLPVDWETEQDGASRPPAAGAARPGSSVSPAPAPAPSPAPGQPEPASDEEFAGLADEGWRAASGMATDGGNELTSAGLPKRRPRARLVPGSAGSAVLAPPVTPARNADNVRGRLTSYQQGVQQGRESRSRGDTGDGDTGDGDTAPAPPGDGGTEPANAGGNHDEESS